MNSKRLKIALLPGVDGLSPFVLNHCGHIELPRLYEIDYSWPLLLDSNWAFFAEDDYRRYIAEQSEGVL